VARNDRASLAFYLTRQSREVNIMKTTLSGLAALTMLVGISGAQPAAALPSSNLLAGIATTQANGTYEPVRWRGGRHYGWGHRYWRPRYGYWRRPGYRSYGYYPYSRRSYGPHVWVGRRGFSFGF